MPLFVRLFAVAFLGIVLAACASTPTSTPTPTSAPAPTTAPATPTVSIAATPTTGTAKPTAATPASTPAAAATSATSAPATPAAVASPARTPAAATPGALPAVQAGQARYVVVPANTEARYRVKEQLANQNLPNDAVGATKDVSGQIVVDASGKVVREASKITVVLTNLRSDQSRRDNFIKQDTLETSRYPEVVLVPTEVRGLDSPLPTSGSVSFDLVGDLTIKGVTKPTTWKATATVEGDEVRGLAQTAVKFGDFGMSQPRVATVLSVEDNIRLELDFHLQRSAS